MPGPLAHIFLAVSLYPQHFVDKDIREFIIGTSFPDIRYICKNIKREQTHYKNITLEMVKNERSSFIAGMLFHALVDETRDKYLHKKSAYKIIPRTEHAIRGIKFLEDVILYDRLKNKDNIAKYFDNMAIGEMLFDAKEKDIKIWHNFIKLNLTEKMTPEHRLACYLSLQHPYLPPTIINIGSFIAVKLNILPKNLKKIIEVIDIFSEHERLLKIINNFYENFETICLEQEQEVLINKTTTN